jgi:hypothetical protein
LLIPLLLPTVPVDEPVVAPGAAALGDVAPVPVELAPPPVDWASANVLVSASAAASPNVAILMDYSLFSSNPQRQRTASVPAGRLWFVHVLLTKPIKPKPIPVGRNGHRGDTGHHKHEAEREIRRHGLAEQHHR